MRDIPVNGELPHSLFQCQLDGVTFGLEFRWNARAQGWFMSVYDASGTLLLAGRRLVIGWGLLSRFKLWNPALPAGDIIVVDTSSQDLQPGLNDIGTRCFVKYLEIGVDV